MVIVEVKKDLFEELGKGYVVHCISGDYSLGAGIASRIDDEMDMRFNLFKNYPIPVGESYANVGKALLVDNVFNLVTKPLFKHKVRYETLWATLSDLQYQCEQLGIKKISMPKIGCGMDKLDWAEVRALIEEVFEDTDIEIEVCIL